MCGHWNGEKFVEDREAPAEQAQADQTQEPVVDDDLDDDLDEDDDNL